MPKGRSTILMLSLLVGSAGVSQSAAAHGQAAAPDTAALDKVLAPVALYPDALIAQILLCSTNPSQVRNLHAWLQKNKNLHGTALQQAAEKQGFEPSLVAIVLFPQVVKMMADSIGWTRQLGQAFMTDKKAVLASIQRLRAQAVNVGNLKTTPQQEVRTEEQAGQQVIVIQPSNPQVVYVPQYNPQTVYVTAPPTTTTVVVKEEDHSGEVAAGLIGFGVGVALGAAIDNDYYYGPYGWGGYGMYYGGGYVRGPDWDDIADHREDMREDWQDHREDMLEDRRDMAEDRQKSRSEQQSSRQQGTTDRQANRQQTTGDRQANRQASVSDRQTSRQQGGAAPGTQDVRSRSSSRGSGVSSLPSSYESRGYGQSGSQMSRQRSSSGGGALSGYERGGSSRASSARGQRSMGRGGRGGRRR